MTTLGAAHVLRGNALALPIADNSVDLIVTSPPYFALRSYQDGGEHYDGQIGAEPSPAAFVDALLEVTQECIRVLKPTGSLWVNLGDKYAQPGKGERSMNGIGSDIAKHHQQVSRKISATYHSYDGIRGKSLLGVPWRYAIRCIDELGLILRAEVVWSKPNGLPESVTDRVRRSHEQWLHFTLEPRYFSAVDEIREPYTPGTAERARAGFNDKRLRGGQNAGHMRHDELREGYETNPLGKLPGSVWTIATEPLKVPDDVAHAVCCAGVKRDGCENGIDHFAAFPTEWPKRLIQGWSPSGVCTACGEGRRPLTRVPKIGESVGASVRDHERTGAVKHGANSTLNRSGGPAQRWRDQNPATITGYVCACNEPIASPTGAALEPDPSVETGRGGLNRPRGADTGVRVVTRWEQRHEAEQLRGSPHQTEMTQEAGAQAFAHYVRTDRAGARPIPEHLRTVWRSRGWLTETPPYTPAPTEPAVVLDPFGGTGTTAMVAKALGRIGISVDLSHDYCRLGKWRTSDRNQLAKVLDIPKVAAPDVEQLDLFGGGAP